MKKKKVVRIECPVESENNWHNITDPEWLVIANAFKSYTIEGAVERLRSQGYKIVNGTNEKD